MHPGYTSLCPHTHTVLLTTVLPTMERQMVKKLEILYLSYDDDLVNTDPLSLKSTKNVK